MSNGLLFQIELVRFAYSPHGVFGRLKAGDFEWFTVERPWELNLPRVSCIPIGSYLINLGRYNRGDYPAYELADVPQRSLIKIHVANTMNDILGCIGPGKGLGYIKGLWAVTNSQVAFDEFMEAMEGRVVAEIDIRNAEELG